MWSSAPGDRGVEVGAGHVAERVDHAHQRGLVIIIASIINVVIITSGIMIVIINMYYILHIT